MKNNLNIPLKMIKRAISAVMAVSIVASSVPMTQIAEETVRFTGSLLARAEEFTHPDLPNVELIYGSVGTWCETNESNEQVYSLRSPAYLIAYSWLYKENPQNHKDDVLVFAFSDGADDAGSAFTGFVPIGDSAANAFQGRIEVNPSTTAQVSLDCAMFGYLRDSVMITAEKNPAVQSKLVFARTVDDAGYPLLAENVLDDANHSPANGWNVEVWNFSTESGAQSYSYGGIISVLDQDAEVRLSVLDQTEAMILVNGENQNAGRICGTMKTGSVLDVAQMNGNQVSVVKAGNGHAGGLVGAMESGAKLKLSCNAAGQTTTAEIHAEGAGHYAGGLAGYCDGGYIVDAIPSGGTYTIENKLYSPAGAGGIFGFYKPYDGTPSLETGETADATAFDLGHYGINCELNGTGCMGGLFGELQSNGSSSAAMNLAISGAGLQVKYNSNAGGGTVSTENGTESAPVTFGGLVGKYTAAQLDDALQITATGVQSNKTGTAALYGGLIGEVAGNTYVNCSGASVTAVNPNTLTFGGAVAKTSAGFLDIYNLTVTADGYHGGGVVGDLGNGVLRLSGYTDLTSAKGATDGGQIIGARDAALAFAEDQWDLKRCSTTVGLDDIGSWGEIVRFDSTKMQRSQVLTLAQDGHSVTLLSADFDGAAIKLSSAASFAKAALNMQINDEARTTGTLITNADSLSSGLLAKNIKMTADINLTGTGMTGLTRDNGTHLQYSGTEFDGGNHTLTLAIGETYGTRSGSALSESAEDGGKIYRHLYNGLFAKTTGALTVKDVTIGGLIDAHNYNDGTYLGSAAALCTGGITASGVTTNVKIKHYGSKSGAIGSLVGEISSGSCAVSNSEFNCNITGTANSAAVGGVVGRLSSATFTSSFNTVTLTGTVADTGERISQVVGGLIGAINQASGRSDNARTLSLNGITIGTAAKSFMVSGSVKDTGNSSTKSALSTGGLLGYSWYDTQTTLNGVTVTNSTVNATKISGNGNSFAADMAGLVYTATGHWIVNSADLSGLSVSGPIRSLGMLVNRGWHRTTNPDTKASLFLELPANYSYTLSSGFSASPTEVFDELVAYSAEYKQTNTSRLAAMVTENGQGIVSIHTSGDKVIMNGTGCNTYQNQTGVTVGGSKGNPNTRYYYNLDSFRTTAATDAEKLMLWSLHQYADSNLSKYFANPYTDNEITPSASGDQFDMVGYSYYPVDVEQDVSIYGNVKFYNEEIETAETSGTVASPLASDSYARTTLQATSQHYLMHCGLFHNVTASKITIDGQLQFDGTIGKTGDGSGALVCGKLIGSDANHTADLEVDKSDGSIVLDGIAVHNKTTYSPLLINRIGSFTETKMRNVSNTGAYSTGSDVPGGTIDTTGTAASSLIGKVGAETENNVLISKGITIEFEGIKLDGRSNAGNLVDAAMNKAYQTKHSIFTQATLLDEFTCTGSTGTYKYSIIDDWGETTSGTDDARNVTYGKEVGFDTQGQYPDKERRYLNSDGENDMLTRYDADPRTNPTGDLEYTTKFLPYVREPYNAAANHQQIKVNHGNTMFSGCGTYNDPYVIDANGQLEQVANAIAGGSNISDGFKLYYPVSPDDKWCENNKTNHNRYILQGGYYKRLRERQLYKKQTGTDATTGDPIFETDNDGDLIYYAITGTTVLLGRQTETTYPNPKTDNYETADTVVVGSDTYVKAAGEMEEFVSETTADFVAIDTMRAHLAGAYYLIKANVTLTNYLGLGKRNADDSSDLAVFHGVIDCVEGYEVENQSENPLIVNSNGSVVRNLTLNVKKTGISVSQKNQEAFTSTTGVAYGAVFGKVLGGDNIIDNVDVTFDSSTSFTFGGTYQKLAAVGGYVGAVANGDVIFRNMARTKTGTDGTTSEKTYGLTSSSGNGLNGKLGDNNTAWLYVNPVIGRVINGFAVTECNAYRPFEDGSRTYGDNTVEYWLETETDDGQGNITNTPSVSTDAADAANKVGVTMKNGNKNYSITDINKADTTLFTSTTVSNGAITAATVENAQGFFLMSVMVNSGVNAKALGFASGNTFRRADYSEVGTTAADSAKPDDYTDAWNDKTDITSWIRFHYAGDNAVKPTTLTMKAESSPYYLPDGYKGIGNIYQNSDDYRLAITKLNGGGVTISQNTSFYYYSTDFTDSSTKIGYLPNNAIDGGLGLFNYINSNATFENLYLTGNLKCDIMDITKNTWITSTAKTCDTTATYLCGGMLLGTAWANATINNVVIQNVDVFAVRNTGGLIGFVGNKKTATYTIKNTVASDAYNSDKIKVHGRASTGGLIGKVNEGYAKVDMNGHTFNLTEVICESTNRGDDNDYNYGVGGFVGMIRANNNTLNTEANFFKNIVIGTADKQQVVECVKGAAIYTAGVIGIMNKSQGVTIENCSFYNLSVRSRYHAGGLVGYPTTSTPVTVTNVHLYSPLGSTISGIDAGGFIGRSNDSKGTNNNGDGSRIFIIRNCSIDGYTISGSTNAGGVIGYRGAYTNMQLELENFSIADCTILSDGYAGGIAGSLDQQLYGYNIRTQNLDFDSITSGQPIIKGYICANILNETKKKGTIKIAGFSRQGTMDVSLCVGKVGSTVVDATTENIYGDNGYVIFADYNGSCLTSEIPNGFTGSKTFSTVNNGNNVTQATINNQTDNTPYVTSSPYWQIDNSKFLTGDAIYGTTYDTSVIKKILTDRTDETTKSYQYAKYDAIEGFATADDFGDLVKTKYTDISSALGAYGTGLTRTFPVLVVDSLNQKYTTSLINNYIRMLTNTQFDYADQTSAVYTVAIQKWGWDNKNGQWIRTGTPTASGSLNDSDANLKRSSSSSGNFFSITAGNYDNTATQFTMVDVQYMDPSGTGKVAYHLYVPVVVKKMLRYGFESSFKTGTNYKLDYYTPKANFLPENFGNPVTLEFAYTYQQTLEDWTAAIRSGDSMLYSYNKKLVFKDEAQKNSLPPGAKLVLVDTNRQNQMYYAEWSTTSGLYTPTQISNEYHMDLTKMTSGADNSSQFRFAPINDLFTITMARAGNATDNLFMKMTPDVSQLTNAEVSGLTDEEKIVKAAEKQGASIRVMENGAYVYYAPVTTQETGEDYYVIQSVAFSPDVALTDTVKPATAQQTTNLYKIVNNAADAAVVAMYQNQQIYLAQKDENDPEGTAYFYANISGHTQEADGKYHLEKDAYVKESYYLSIFTDPSSSSEIYHYTVNGVDSFNDNAHPSQIESKLNYSRLALGNLYANTFTIKDTEDPEGGAIIDKINLETNNTIRATMESTIGLTDSANGIQFGSLLVKNPNVEIYQSFLLYLNRQDPREEGATAMPKQLNGLLTDTEPQIHVSSYTIGGTEIANPNDPDKITVNANYIEFRNDTNLYSLIVRGVKIRADVELTYNSDTMIAQAFPLRTNEGDTNVGTRMLGYSNIASDKTQTANSTASTMPQNPSTTRYYCQVKNTSELVFEADAADATGLYGRLGINAYSLSGDDADGIVDLAAVASYDINKLNKRETYDKVRLTYQLYTKQQNQNTYFIETTVDGNTVTEYQPLVIPTYLKDFALYNSNSIDTAEETYTPVCNPNPAAATEYVYTLTKAQLSAHQVGSNTYKFFFPVDFGIYTGDTYFGSGKHTPQRMYSNYKLMLKVELLNNKDEVIDEKRDWIVYTNAKINADIVTGTSP